RRPEPAQVIVEVVGHRFHAARVELHVLGREVRKATAGEHILDDGGASRLEHVDGPGIERRRLVRNWLGAPTGAVEADAGAVERRTAELGSISTRGDV